MARSAKLLSAPRALAYWSGFAGRRQRAQNAARILLLHGTPRDGAAELERQLRYLKQRFDIVSLGEIVERLGARADMTRMVALTFDDGLRNNVEVAYPILRRLRIPAAFFVCPGLIARGEWLWTHQTRQRLRHAPAGLVRELARQLGAPHAVDPFVDWMKTLALQPRKSVERTVREATPGYLPSAAERHAFDLAGWDELRRLDPALLTIGSHTSTHPILPCLSAAQAEAELADSRRMLEEQLQRAVEYFAYPNGDHSAGVCALVRRHYRAAVSSIRDWTRHESETHLLPRVGMPRGVLRLALAMHRNAATTSRTDQNIAVSSRSRASQAL